MKKTAIFILACLLMVGAFAGSASAGPWTLAQGRVWTEVFTRYFYAKENFDAVGNRSRWNDGGKAEIWDLSFKFEYGATNRLNLLLEVPYTWSRWNNDWGRAAGSSSKLKHEGFKEIILGGKYKLTETPIASAVQFRAFIHPTSTDRVKGPDLFEYGDALEGRILLGKSLTVYNKLFYTSVETGYRLRSALTNDSDFANTIPVFWEAGLAPLDWLMFKGELDFSFSHQSTGIRKDTLTWRAGPIISIFGKGFSSIEKGDTSSLNVELQIGQTVWGRGDGSSQNYGRVNAAMEYIVKVQALF